MSVDQISLSKRVDGDDLKIIANVDHFGFIKLSVYATECWIDYPIDRHQAHILYMYLKEKLMLL